MVVTRLLLAFLLALLLVACTDGGGASRETVAVMSDAATPPSSAVGVVMTWADADWNPETAAALRRCAALPGVEALPRIDAMSPVVEALRVVGTAEQTDMAVFCARSLPRAEVEVKNG